MAINQVQLRLSIDGQQALSTIDALGIKQADLMQSTKAMTEARTQDMNALKNGLVEIYKLQEKQALLEKQMAAASESGKLTQLSKLEGIYEANGQKLTELFEIQTNYNEAIHLNDLAILENSKAIRANNAELEKLYVTEGRTLVAEAKLVAEKKALNREASLAGNGSDRQRIALDKLALVEKELTQRTADRAKTAVAGMQKIIKEQGIEKVSTQDLITLTKSLETANRHRTERFTDDAKEEIKSIKEVNAELAKRKEETAPDSEGFSLGGMMKNLKGGLGSAVVGGMAGALAGGILGAAMASIEKIGEAIGATIDRIAKKATEITAIQTSLDVTRLKAREINQSLNDIDTKTSVSELNNLVEVAGSLNVPLEEVNKFVKEADKTGVVLGKAFGGAAEAVTQIAKLKEEYRDTKDLKIDESLSKIGSVLKALDLAGPASVDGITDFLKRAGNIPDAIKPSITQLAAFAAVFEEANLSSEISASSFGKILQEGANNLDLFGKQMGVSANYVKVLINQDPNAFILKFSESLKGLNGTQLAQTLRILHLEGSETFKTVGVLTDNIEKLREKQNLTNNEFERANTINRIFNDINTDEAAKIEKISKSWDKLKNSLSSWAALLVGPVINSLAKTTEKTENLTESYLQQAKRANNLEASAVGLLQKYHDLSEAAKLGAKNQNELNKTIANIGKVVPEAVTAYDTNNNAIRFNIGLVEIAIEKHKKLAESMKLSAKNEIRNESNALLGERAEINKKLNAFTKLEEKLRDPSKLQAHELGRYTYERDKLKGQIADLHKRSDEINAQVMSNRKKFANLDIEQDVPRNTEPPKTGSTYKNLGKSGKSSDSNKAENERIRREKYEQTQRDNMIELQAKLAFEEKMALADDEKKKILTAEKRAKEELKQVRTQFKDIDGIVIKHAKQSKEQQELINREVVLIKKRLAEEKISIEREYLKKQDDAYEAHANKAIQIAQDAKREELQRNLNNAKRQGGRLGIFNAEERIINNDEAVETFSENFKYLKEQEAAKDNAAALILIKEIHEKAIEAIQTKYRNRRDAHLAEATDKEKDIAEKNKLNSLGLDIREAEQGGQNPLQAKIALLDAQRAIEIANADKTGAAIADIDRNYRLKRAALEQEDARTRAEKALQHFDKAFSAISSIFSASLQNRSAEEDTRHEQSIKKLDDQKEHGVLTNRQYNKQKQLADKEHDKAQRKIKREQWELDKAATLTNIAMQTALAVMKAAPNIPLQIITGVLGGIQFGVAASQKAPAYAKGGLISADAPLVNKPSKSAIQIWANEEGQEYMSPAWQLQDPALANLFGVLEYRRQNKITGYAKGGFIGDDTPPLLNTPTKSLSPNKSEGDYLLMQLLQQNIEVLYQVSESVQNIKANIQWTEPDTYELSKKQNSFSKKLDSSYSNTNQSLIE
jgi:outer membrane lipoprotein SlyB